jgi:hypothetical protein
MTTMTTIKRASLLIAVVTFACAVAAPARADFHSLAEAVSQRPNVHRVWTPFFGLARAAVWVVSPHGVHDLQLVTFEGRGLDDGEAIGNLVARHANGYRPLVRVRQRNGDWSYIYAKDGNRGHIDLLIFAHDHGEDTVLIRVEVDPDVIARDLGEPRHAATSIARR